MNALDYSLRSNQEQAQVQAPATCTYPGCDQPTTRRIHWRSTQLDPVLHSAASCARHEVHLGNQAHIVAIEVWR